jgi:hypothetical protein
MNTNTLRKSWCNDNNKPSILCRPELVGYKADCYSVNVGYIEYLEDLILERLNNESN